MTDKGDRKMIITTVVLYLFIISSGLQMGAANYESFVITPSWSGSPQQSVMNWNLIRAYTIEPAEFWRRGTPFYSVCAVLILSAAWLMPVPNGRLALAAGFLAVLVVASTRLFFIPILSIFTNGAGLSGAEITDLATQWVSWNRRRVAAGFVAWLAAIRALSLPPAADPVADLATQPHTAYRSVSSGLRTQKTS